MLLTENQKLTCQFCRGLSGVFNLHQFIMHGFHRIEAHKRHVRKSPHGCKQCIEIMGDAPCQFADSFHFL